MKKITFLKKTIFTILLLFVFQNMNAQIYTNGSFINSPASGVSGADESWLQNNSLNMDMYGSNVNSTYFYRIADDFVVPAGEQWRIDSAFVYCYQTLAPIAPSPIVSINMRVLNDAGGAPGTSVVWGDTTTDVLSYSEWANCYRVSELTTGTASNRAVYRNVCNTPSLVLSAGTYWLDFSILGSSSFTGPWANPLVIIGNTTTGNGMQSRGAMGPWSPALDDSTFTQQGFPFSLFGMNLLGVNESEIFNNISVYPNPVNDFTTVKIELLSVTPSFVELSNLLGEKLFVSNTENKKQYTQKIDCTKLSSGCYILKVIAGNEMITRKLNVIR